MTFWCVFFSFEQKPVILCLSSPASFSLNTLKDNKLMEFVGQSPINLSKIHLPIFQKYVPRKWVINRVVNAVESMSDLPEERLLLQQRQNIYLWWETLLEIINECSFISYKGNNFPVFFTLYFTLQLFLCLQMPFK